MTFEDIDQRMIKAFAIGKHRRHEFDRVIFFEPRRLIRLHSIRGAVRLAKSVTGKTARQSPDFLDVFLGMAPLSGLENRALGTLWNRFGSLTYRFGENFYNFQGLRQYKEKFDPTWEPMYVASPGGLALPRILTNLAALISGGLRGVVTK